MRHGRSFDTYSPEALREVSRKAGIKSGESRRRKRAAVEREKIKDMALREMQDHVQRENRANIRILRQSIRVLSEAKRTMDHTF